MRVGIVEVMDSGHVVLAETLCKIFCSEKQNEVFFFTIKNHAENLNHLTEIYPNLSIVIKSSNQNTEDFLQEIGLNPLDRFYVVTLNKLFPAFSRWQINGRLFLVVHNLDEWFYLSFFQNTGKFIRSVIDKPRFKLLLYFFKSAFIYPSYKKQILKIVGKTNGCLVVLSESVLKEFKKLKINMPVEVIPFSVFDPLLVSGNNGTQRLFRICVPGILSQYRRNYLGLLDLVEKKLVPYKKHFILDFLGGIQSDNLLNDSNPILEKIENLNNEGFTIITHPVKFIPQIEYDFELSLADVILGNINVVLNKYSEYGRTKETGLPFAMIKVAKPGILPDNYPFPKELNSSILQYHDFKDLERILIDLITDPLIILNLKKEALINSKKFTPEIIYYQIIAENK